MALYDDSLAPQQFSASPQIDSWQQVYCAPATAGRTYCAPTSAGGILCDASASWRPESVSWRPDAVSHIASPFAGNFTPAGGVRQPHSELPHGHSLPAGAFSQLAPYHEVNVISTSRSSAVKAFV